MAINKMNIKNCFFVLILGLLANCLYNEFDRTIEINKSRNTFLQTPDNGIYDPDTKSVLYFPDLFADYLKVTLSLPNSNLVHYTKNMGLYNIIKYDINYNPYSDRPDEELRKINKVSHLHLPPFAQLYYLKSLDLMKILQPATVVYLNIILLVIIALVIPDVQTLKSSFKYGSLIIFFSYPFLFGIQRGNFAAMITGLMLIHFLLNIYKHKCDTFLCLLISIAINFRPNSAIFIAALTILNHSEAIKSLIKIALATIIIFIISYCWDHNIYPIYTFHTMLDGLKNYHYLYAYYDGGLNYGSSAFGLAKIMIGNNVLIEFICFLFPLLFLLLSVALYYKKYIHYSSLIFIMCCAYTLSSSVFSDYHLLCFVVPLLISISEVNSIGFAEFKVKNILSDYNINIYQIFISISLLIPKHYIFIQNDVSLQTLLNPIIILFFFFIITIRFIFVLINKKYKLFYQI